MTITEEAVARVYTTVKQIYDNVHDLPFHGWHHIEFVYRKVPVFAVDLGANVNLVRVCALVHDLNYVVHKQKWTSAAAGCELRAHVLSEAGFDQSAIDQIEMIVREEATENRTSDISIEAQALSDADSLFKILPITPILFASRFIAQTGYDIRKLANKVVGEQKPLLDKGIYFYSSTAKTEYENWARINLDLWNNVTACLNDPDVVDLLKMAGFNVSDGS